MKKIVEAFEVFEIRFYIKKLYHINVVPNANLQYILVT